MAKKTKQTNFFPGSRRECTLTNYELLASKGEEKRSKMQFSMLLTGKDVKGMPDWISNPWSEMQKEGSCTGRSSIEVKCEGMTMEIFSTAKIRQRALSSTGVMITALALVPTGEGDTKDVALSGTIYVPANKILHDWAWELIHKTYFAAFEYSQSEMDFDGDDDSDDAPGLNDDEGEEEPVPAAAGPAIVAGNKKSGPKDLASYHAQHPN